MIPKQKLAILSIAGARRDMVYWKGGPKTTLCGPPDEVYYGN
ncbi:hypothetical protein SUBVAR_06903 [Subdoligranulum variabile DSM 15176]|uniref:Uncharacterized protein n=1 Tax=Subdoligranulum variabile DSM 15176 TaxID=411471 RepID=D1PR75_9FIRM|nr:hypothetical protein SUBVAR_06903 [Subdoligranulum variabile DSM 15176]